MGLKKVVQLYLITRALKKAEEEDSVVLSPTGVEEFLRCEPCRPSSRQRQNLERARTLREDKDRAAEKRQRRNMERARSLRVDQERAAEKLAEKKKKEKKAKLPIYEEKSPAATNF